MSNELSKIVRDLTALRKQVHGLSTTSQINHSSLDNSTIVAYDADGHERLRIGRQDDGTHAIKHVQGPPPPQPSAPTVTVDGVVITVEHDGTNVGDAPLPADYRRRIVYAGFAPDMSDAVPVATIEPPAGGQAVFMSPGDGTVYVAVKNETFSAALSVHSHAVPVEVTMVSLEGELEIIKDSANGKNKNYYSPTAPESGSEGDVWFDTSIDPETGQPKWGLNLWDGSEWVSARDSRLQVVEKAQEALKVDVQAVKATADGKNTVFRQPSKPSGQGTIGDIWFDTSASGKNRVHVWDGQIWVSTADVRTAEIEEAQKALSNALTKAKADLGADIAGVKASVDGKSTITWSASDATGSGAAGDTWFKVAGNAIVGYWSHNGKGWVKRSLDPVVIPKIDIGQGTFGLLDGARLKAASVVADTVIVEGSIGSTLIQDGAVTTEKLTAKAVTTEKIATGAITAESGVVGSLDAGKITVGELDGARIKAGTVAADKVLIGSGGNLIPNGDGLTTSNAGFTGVDFDSQEKALVMPSNGTRYSSATFRVEPGEYELSADIKGPAGSHVYVGIADDVNRWAYGISNVTITGAWKTYTSTLVVDQARSEQPQVVRILPGYGDKLPSSEKTWIRNISLRKKVGTTVIADGAITTEKIATGAITAESGVIGSVDAGKITVGELDGARIKANTIGTDLLKAGAVTSKILSADAIDGKTITGATVRTSIQYPNVEINAGGLVAHNPNGVPTFTASSTTGDVKLVGVLESGLPGARRVVINDSLWVNKPYLRKNGGLGYSDAAGIRLGYDADPTMHGDISFAEIVTVDEVESEDGHEVVEVEKVTPSLTIEGPGLSTQEKASIDMYQTGSLIVKHGGTLTLRPTVATGERLTMHRSGSLTLKSRGDAELYMRYTGYTRLRSGNGARVDLLDGITLQSNGRSSVYLRTGTGRAYITVGYESNERNLYSASEHRFLGGDIYYFNAKTVSYNANLYLGTSGRISKGSASSRRYKLDIQDYDVPEELLDVPFRTWVDKTEAEEAGTTDGLPRVPGLIAEEVAAIDPIFVIYDDQGRPDALHGDRIGMAALTILRRQRDRIDGLEARLEALEERG